MPTLNLKRSDFEDIVSIEIEILSAMLHPTEPAKREQLATAIKAEITTQYLETALNEGIYIEVTAAQAVELRRARMVEYALDDACDPALSSFKGKGDYRVHGGQIAGHVLLIGLAMAGSWNVPIGSGAALRVVHHWLGALRGASEGNLKRIWETYAPVAHFWAASILLEDDAQDWGRADLGELVRFLRLADQLHNLGAQIHVPRSRVGSGLIDNRTAYSITFPREFKTAAKPFDKTWRIPREWADIALASNILD